ncbi:MAG: glutamate 5-kinase [Deltaproteobacteria bacterium]|nr:glutamate 5-kinase [Deltaproteobacteria bacterium]
MTSVRQPYLNKARRIVLKVGSAVLTTPEGLNLPLIERLVAESGALQGGEREFIIVSSGAIAAGCRKLGLSSRPTGIPEQQAVAAAGQSALMLAYEEAFAGFGLKVAQILLTHDDLESRQRFLNARNTLFTLLQWRVVPIINENDTVATDELKLKFGDNDNLAALICNLVGADLLIILTDIDGLFDKDPREHPDARLVTLVEAFDAELEKAASGKAGALGRGGMGSKLQAAKKAAAAGLPTIIANGLTPGILKQIFAGEEVGTLFLPQAQKLKSRQYWLAYNVNPKGAILVDQGAWQALVKRHKSLLPAGIVAVFGGFGKGAAVQLMDPEGRPFAIGLSNYSARDIARIQGRQTKEIEQFLGQKGYDEVIHRDNLVIFPEI